MKLLRIAAALCLALTVSIGFVRAQEPTKIRFTLDWKQEAVAIGVGDIDQKRMTDAIATVADAYQLPRVPRLDEVFNRTFLPAKTERELSAVGK